MTDRQNTASGSFTARPGEELHAAMIEAARRDGTSLAAWTNDLFARALGRLPIVPRTVEDLRAISSLTVEQADALTRIPGLVTIISGRMASGKTTLIKAIVRDQARRDRRIAIVSASPGEYLGLTTRDNNIVFIDIASMIEAERRKRTAERTSPDDAPTIEHAVALNVSMWLVAMNIDLVVLDGHRTPAYAEIGTALVQTARTGLTLIVEVPAGATTNVTERLRTLGIEIQDDDVALVVLADRDPSTGRITFASTAT